MYFTVTGSITIGLLAVLAEGGAARGAANPGRAAAAEHRVESPRAPWPACPYLAAAAHADTPRPLSARGLTNLRAFAYALGYVRFFHPSDEAVRVNWDAFAIQGVRAVESATGADSLASALRTLFAPIAPTVAFGSGGVAVAPVAKPPGATHVIFWRHLGVGSPSGGPSTGTAPSYPGPYRSERVTVPLSEVGWPIASPGARARTSAGPLPRVPDPAWPLRVPLSEGVTLSLPVALYSTSAHVSSGLSRPDPTPTAERMTGEDRATRLAAVALAWSLFQHFYPYFDVVQTDWPAALDTALVHAATDSTVIAFEGTLRRLVAALHDGHGSVYHPSRSLAIPDIRLGLIENQVVVLAAGERSSRLGVHRGDVVLALDGHPIAEAAAGARALSSAATPQWSWTRALSSMLAGGAGETLTLRVQGDTGPPRDVTLMRAQTAAEEPRPERIATVGPGVLYVDLGRITTDEFRAAIPQLQTARGIVFDMRGYPRQVNTAEILAHLTDSTIRSHHFLTPVRTMPAPSEVGYIDGAWILVPIAPRFSGRVAFLSGGGAISYAESTLGVVESYRLGDIVGEPSAGTNGNANPFVLPGGYSVRWTGMRVVKRDGTPLHGVGVVPTVRVSPTLAGIRAGRDEVLERAIAIVSRASGN